MRGASAAFAGRIPLRHRKGQPRSTRIAPHMTIDSAAVATAKPAEIAGGCNCRFCGTRLLHTFVDLGMSPLCQTHISSEQLNHMEPFYPLHAYVCHECFLVQLDEYVAPD